MTDANSILAIELETAIARAGEAGMSLPKIRGTISQALAKVEIAWHEETEEQLRRLGSHAVARFNCKRYERKR